MRTTEAYGDLLQLDRPVLTTREAAARWRTEQGTAARRLRALEEANLVRRLRRSLWALDPEVEPFVLAPFLTAPYPAYVSLWSALARHEMIEQIPRQVSVVSLDRPRAIETSVGTFAIHRVAPPVFGGFSGSERSGYVAEPEKAVFDTVYLRAAAGSRAFFPELVLPAGFKPAEISRWVDRIESRRLRTIVSRRLRDVLRQAS